MENNEDEGRQKQEVKIFKLKLESIIQDIGSKIEQYKILLKVHKRIFLSLKDTFMFNFFTSPSMYYFSIYHLVYSCKYCYPSDEKILINKKKKWTKILNQILQKRSKHTNV